MFSSSRRLVNVSLRASRLFTTNNNFSSLSSSRLAISFSPIKDISIRTYSGKRGASSRPVKTKEREETQQDAPLSSQYQQQQQTPGYYEQQQQYPYEQNQQYDYQQTASQHVSSNVSLQAFLKRSMVTTAAGVGISAVSTAVFMQIPAVLAHPYIAMGVGLVGAMGALFGMGASQPQYVREGEIVKAIDSPTRQALFGTLLVAEGLSFAPMIKIVSIMTPMAIPIAGALAVGTMAGMAAYALRQPQGSLAKWGPALYVGVFGLIGAGIVNMFLHSSILSMATSAAGIAIFSAFTAYDTHTAIQEHNEGRPDHLLTAANFYLNFVNLFMYYLRIVQSFLED